MISLAATTELVYIIYHQIEFGRKSTGLLLTCKVCECLTTADGDRTQRLKMYFKPFYHPQ